MSRLHKQTFIQGSLILLIAHGLIKLIGALFKIPLFSLLGEEGMGYFNAAYVIYNLMFTIATAGLPVAVSKMISESIARHNDYEAKRILRISYYIFSVIGIVCSLSLFFGAEFFAHYLKFDNAAMSIRAISPAILFVSLMSIYRGFFQGLQNMIPTAVSEVIEAVGKLFIGFTLAYILFPRGLQMAASGAVAGVSIGSLLGFVVLIIIYKKYKGHIFNKDKSQSKNTPSGRAILKELINIAVPITIGASVFTLSSLLDLALIGNRLDVIKDTLTQTPVELYGLYSGTAVTMFNMPPTIIIALCLSLVPAIAGAYAVYDKLTVRKTTEQALKLTILFSLPSSVGLGILAKPILQLIFNRPNAAPMLYILSLSVFFVCMVLVTNAVLQATGRVYKPIINMLVGAIIKTVATYILVAIPGVDILGAPIATDLCYLIYMVLNLRDVKKVTGAKYTVMDFWLKPLISSAAMGISALFIYNWLYSILQHTKIGLGAALAVGIGFGMLVYMLMLFSLNCIKEEDIILFPKGVLLADKLKALKILR